MALQGELVFSGDVERNQDRPLGWKEGDSLTDLGETSKCSIPPESFFLHLRSRDNNTNVPRHHVNLSSEPGVQYTPFRRPGQA